jgi:hypothetical protein
MATSAEVGREAEVLLQVPSCSLAEVRGQQKNPLVADEELIIISMIPTPEELEMARLGLNLPPGSLEARGKALVFILLRDNRLPITPSVPLIRNGPFEFTAVLPPGVFMQLTFAEDTHPEILEAFEIIVKTYGTLREKPGQAKQAAPAVVEHGTRALTVVPPAGQLVPHQEKKLSTRVAQGLTMLSTKGAGGIKKASEVLSHGVTVGTDKIVEKTKVNETPTEVSDETLGHIRKTRMVTKSAVLITSGLAATMIGVSAAIGDTIGTRLAKRVPKPGEDDKYAGVKEVGLAAVGAAGSIVMAATDASRLLLNASCEGIAKVINHKYGQQAGEAVSEGLGCVTDAYTASTNMSRVGVGAVVSNASKNAAAKVFSDTPH